MAEINFFDVKLADVVTQRHGARKLDRVWFKQVTAAREIDLTLAGCYAFKSAFLAPETTAILTVKPGDFLLLGVRWTDPLTTDPIDGAKDYTLYLCTEDQDLFQIDRAILREAKSFMTGYKIKHQPIIADARACVCWLYYWNKPANQLRPKIDRQVAMTRQRKAAEADAVPPALSVRRRPRSIDFSSPVTPGAQPGRQPMPNYKL